LFKNTCQPIQKLTGSSAAVKRTYIFNFNLGILLNFKIKYLGVRASDTAFGFNNLFDAHFEKIE